MIIVSLPTKKKKNKKKNAKYSLLIILKELLNAVYFDSLFVNPLNCFPLEAKIDESIFLAIKSYLKVTEVILFYFFIETGLSDILLFFSVIAPLFVVHFSTIYDKK